MEVIHHERSPKPEQMELQHDPLRIWLSRKLEIVVTKGDRLGDVAEVVQAEGWLSKLESRQLVALWFAIGERRGNFRPTNTTWNAEELDASRTRRYLTRSSA